MLSVIYAVSQISRLVLSVIMLSVVMPNVVASVGRTLDSKCYHQWVEYPPPPAPGEKKYKFFYQAQRRFCLGELGTVANCIKLFGV
jgi:hypothetical protein